MTKTEWISTKSDSQMVSGIKKKQKMKKILMLICLVFSQLVIQLQAQNPSLSIVENSVKIKRDTLYFTYRITNKTSSTFVFYNVRLFSFYISRPKEFENVKQIYPFFLIKMVNSKNKLPNTKYHQLPPDKSPSEESLYKSSDGKYVVLMPNKSIEYKHFKYIGNIGYDGEVRNLKNDTYKIQLIYVSNNYFRSRFNKVKGKNAKLKNAILFNQSIYSDSITFKYIKNQ